MVNSRPSWTPSESIFPAVRLASQRDLFVAGIRRRYFHRFSSRCGVLMLHANRSGDLGRHATPTPRVLDGASRRSRRVRLNFRAHPGRAARARARRRSHRRLEHSRHRDGRVLLAITLAPQATAAAAPQCCSRRRLLPTLARVLRRRLARLLPAHGCSRCCPASRARPPARLAFPRRDLPRSLLLRAARAAGSYCVSLRAPQARGPDGCSSVSGLLAGWSGSCHVIRHAEPVCSRLTVTD